MYHVCQDDVSVLYVGMCQDVSGCMCQDVCVRMCQDVSGCVGCVTTVGCVMIYIYIYMSYIYVRMCHDVS